MIGYPIKIIFPSPWSEFEFNSAGIYRHLVAINFN